MVSVETKLALMHKDIKYIKQELPGLIKRVRIIEDFKNKVFGGFIVVSGIATSSLALVIINWIWG